MTDTVTRFLVGAIADFPDGEIRPASKPAGMPCTTPLKTRPIEESLYVEH